AFEDIALEDEKAAVDVAARERRFFRELDDAALIELDLAEAARRAHRGDGGRLAVTSMKREQMVQVYVGQTVAVGQEKCVALDVFLDALEAAAGHRVQPGFRERDVPVFGHALPVDLKRIVLAERQRYVGLSQMVFEEKALDRPALVAQAQDEVDVAIFGE